MLYVLNVLRFCHFWGKGGGPSADAGGGGGEGSLSQRYEGKALCGHCGARTALKTNFQQS